MQTHTPASSPDNEIELLDQIQIGHRWNCHRTTVLRICRRYGYSGLKFGNRASARRFALSTIKKIEKSAGFSGGGNSK